MTARMNVETRLAWDRVTGFAPEKPVKCKFCLRRMPNWQLEGHALSAHASRFRGFRKWLYAVESKAASYEIMLLEPTPQFIQLLADSLNDFDA